MNPLDMTNVTGKLDRSISELIWIANNTNLYDAVDLQTLKHHCEDMQLAVNKISEVLDRHSIKVQKP